VLKLTITSLAEISNSITAATLHDLSHTWFSKNAGPAEIKDSIRMLIHYADAHLEEALHLPDVPPEKDHAEYAPQEY
jgi:hypothetical protein